MMKKMWRRRYLALLAALFLLIFGLPTVTMAEEAGAVFAGGTGSESDPYRIEQTEQLAALADLVNNQGLSFQGQYFQLEQDLDLTGWQWVPIGNAGTAFAGHFDGQGHAIRDMKIVAPNNNSGLFGQMADGSISNVVIRDCSINIRGSQNVGAFVGLLKNSTVENCTVMSGNIIGKNAVGGIVGYVNGNGLIVDCENRAEVTGTDLSIGGIIGQTNGVLEMNNCFNQGAISGKGSVGGIIGYSYKQGTKVQNCYNKGLITSSSDDSGALLGNANNTTNLSYCYYDQGSAQLGYPKKAEAKQISEVAPGGGLATVVMIDGTSYDQLDAALNAWLDWQGLAYRHWWEGGLLPSYLVQFFNEQGERLESVWVQEGERVAQPAVKPKRKGYDCLGWSTDGETLWQFAQDQITAPQQMVPVWQPRQITLTVSEASRQGQVGRQELLYDFSQIGIDQDSDGEKSYRLKEGQELPKGLSLNAAGLLAGTPAEAVRDEMLIFVVTGANGTEAEIKLRLTILPAALTTYAITTESTVGGSIMPKQAVVAAGGSQTFDIVAEGGYVIQDVLLDGHSVGAVKQYLVADVQEAHHLAAQFAWTSDGGFDGAGDSGDGAQPPDKQAAPVAPPMTGDLSPLEIGYADAEKHWGAQAIQYVQNRGLMTGVAPGRFGPDEPATRAMLAVVLWRLAGEPSVEAAALYGDVEESMWYGPSVTWAAQQGIMLGVAKERFAPEATISRQEMAVLLYRLAGRAEKGEQRILQQFTDGSDTAQWAAEAMSWAVEKGLLVGRTPELLGPQEGLTRAEVAVVLERLLKQRTEVR